MAGCLGTDVPCCCSVGMPSVRRAQPAAAAPTQANPSPGLLPATQLQRRRGTGLLDQLWSRLLQAPGPHPLVRAFAWARGKGGWGGQQLPARACSGIACRRGRCRQLRRALCLLRPSRRAGTEYATFWMVRNQRPGRGAADRWWHLLLPPAASSAAMALRRCLCSFPRINPCTFPLPSLPAGLLRRCHRYRRGGRHPNRRPAQGWHSCAHLVGAFAPPVGAPVRPNRRRRLLQLAPTSISSASVRQQHCTPIDRTRDAALHPALIYWLRSCAAALRWHPSPLHPLNNATGQLCVPPAAAQSLDVSFFMHTVRLC